MPGMFDQKKEGLNIQIGSGSSLSLHGIECMARKLEKFGERCLICRKTDQSWVAPPPPLLFWAAAAAAALTDYWTG